MFAVQSRFLAITAFGSMIALTMIAFLPSASAGPLVDAAAQIEKSVGPDGLVNPEPVLSGELTEAILKTPHDFPFVHGMLGVINKAKDQSVALAAKSGQHSFRSPRNSETVS